MSAFIGLLAEEYVFIGTDTLTRYPTEPSFVAIKPRNFANKVFHLPQFKSVFATTGLQMIAIVFERILIENYIGRDINSIVGIDITMLLEHLNAEAGRLSIPSGQLKGSIFLYGLNYQSNKFEGYRLRLDPDSIQVGWIKLKYINEGAITLSPPIEDYWDKQGSDPSPSASVKALMVVQKEEDDARPVMDQAGIGGDITFTQLQIDESGQIVISTFILHRFADFDQHFRIMIQGRN